MKAFFNGCFSGLIMVFHVKDDFICVKTKDRVMNCILFLCLYNSADFFLLLKDIKSKLVVLKMGGGPYQGV